MTDILLRTLEVTPANIKLVDPSLISHSYSELSLDTQLAIVLDKTDVGAFVQTPNVSISAVPIETDTVTYHQLEVAWAASLAPDETDGKGVQELLLALGLSGTSTEQDNKNHDLFLYSSDLDSIYNVILTDPWTLNFTGENTAIALAMALSATDRVTYHESPSADLSAVPTVIDIKGWVETRRLLAASMVPTETDVVTYHLPAQALGVTVTPDQTTGLSHIEAASEWAMSATSAGMDSQGYFDLVSAVGLSATPTETSLWTAHEINKALSLLTTLAETDVGAFNDIESLLEVALSLDERDRFGMHSLANELAMHFIPGMPDLQGYYILPTGRMPIHYMELAEE